jgi:hypothetical protein
MNNLIFSIKKNKIFYKICIIIIGILLFIPIDILTFPSTGLDSSWIVGLSLAAEKNLIFGTDIVFTYGQWGYLMTGLPLSNDKYFIILFKFFLIINALFFYYYTASKIKNLYVFCFILFFFLVYNFLFSPYIEFILYFYFLFYLFLFFKNENYKYLLIIYAVLFLSFYIKVSVGFVSNILFFITFLIIIIFKKNNRLKNIIFLIIFIIIHFIILLFYKINFINYIFNSIEMINYYNDSMYIKPKLYVLLIAFSITFIILLFISFRIKHIYRDLFKILLSVNLLIFIFIVFKQSFVRFDEGHYSLFFLIIPCLFIFINDIYFDDIKLNNYYVVFLFLSISFFSINIKYVNLKFSLITNFNTLFRYDKLLENSQNISKESDYQNDVPNVYIPFKFKNKIGKRSIDIYPTEISYAYFNNLNYCPRPVFQSYSAYSTKLLNLNYDKYNSSSAPELVLFHTNVRKLEDQNPFWWDTKTQIALLENYNILDSLYKDSNNLLILFEKSKIKSNIKKKLLFKTKVSLNKLIDIPIYKGILYMECDIDYTSFGKVRRFLFQPSPLKINLSSDMILNSSFRGSLPILNSGIILNSSFYNVDGKINHENVYNFFFNKRSSSKNYKTIIFKGNKNWIKDEFFIYFYELSL